MTTADKTDTDRHPYKDIGQRLKAIRLSVGMSVKDFACYMRLNYTRYINWESGHRRLLPDEAADFCDRFNVTLDFIYLGRLETLPHKVMVELSSKLDDINQSKSSDTSNS